MHIFGLSFKLKNVKSVPKGKGHVPLRPHASSKSATEINKRLATVSIYAAYLSKMYSKFVLSNCFLQERFGTVASGSLSW